MILTWHDTWHATSTCHIMPSWADTGTYRDHPGPLLETMPCIESSVIMCAFFPDDFMHAFSIACRKTSHNWLHMAPPSKQLRYMTDGVLLRETLFEPDLDRYCAWKPRDFMFPMKPILHSKTQTWLYKNSEQSHDFWGWWVSRHSRFVDSCWLHMTPYDSIFDCWIPVFSLTREAKDCLCGSLQGCHHGRSARTIPQHRCAVWSALAAIGNLITSNKTLDKLYYIL